MDKQNLTRRGAAVRAGYRSWGLSHGRGNEHGPGTVPISHNGVDFKPRYP